MIRFEVCANSYQSICNTIEGGADCAELCEALEVGGVTPLKYWKQNIPSVSLTVGTARRWFV